MKRFTKTDAALALAAGVAQSATFLDASFFTLDGTAQSPIRGSNDFADTILTGLNFMDGGSHDIAFTFKGGVSVSYKVVAQESG